MRVSKINLQLSMKVQPVRYEPFDVSTGAEVELTEGEDPVQAHRQLEDFVSSVLEQALVEQLDKYYGAGTGHTVIDRNRKRKED